MARESENAMEQQKKPADKAKPKSLSLTVKTLEKKSAPRMAKEAGASPVIGYS
jgi:hypothetical protein